MLEIFTDLLTKAEALIVGDSPLLTSWHQDDATGDPDSQILYATWESGNLRFSTRFTEANIAAASFDRETGEFRCPDFDGKVVAIKLFRLTALTPY